MDRSSGIPRQRGLRGITAIIRSRTKSTTVTRVTETTGALDQAEETKSEHSESLWLFEPEEARSRVPEGERIDGDLGALAIADGTVDIQNGDRLTHGGVEYEVDTVVGRPDDGSTDYWAINLVRRH